MTITEMVQAFMTALEVKDSDRAASYLSDDFIFSGFTPQPLDKSQFLKVMAELKSGMPNLVFHLHDVHEVQEKEQTVRVEATTQITGTQTAGFILPPLSLPPIPQLGESVSLPEEHWRYVIRDNKITRIIVDRVPGGGIGGLLHQLGVDVPIIQ
jgi:hypothetical protein